MANKRVVYPYCRRCRKTRSNPDEWAKLTSAGKSRKSTCCGTCGQMLAWGPSGKGVGAKGNVPQTVARFKDTSTDIKDNVESWKKFLGSSYAKIKLICSRCGKQNTNKTLGKECQKCSKDEVKK